MKTNLTRLLAAAFFLTAISVLSCNKEKSADSDLTVAEEAQASQTTSESDAEAELIFDDVFDNVMGVNNNVGMAGTGVFGRQVSTGTLEVGRVDSVGPTACFTVSVTALAPPNLFPLRIVIDFGNGCTGRDGRTRYGKIIATYTNRLIVPGATATTTFEGYRVDSTSVQGSHVITNTSTANVRQFTVAVEGAKLSRVNGNYTEWNSHKTITQYEGLGTPELPFDDIFRIEGKANGKVKKDNLIVGWNTEITNPLIKRFTCHWIGKGTVRIVRLNTAANSPWIATLDYGNGDCNNRATITINGVVHEISLH